MKNRAMRAGMFLSDGAAFMTNWMDSIWAMPALALGPARGGHVCVPQECDMAQFGERERARDRRPDDPAVAS
jgi:hypothetical protein